MNKLRCAVIGVGHLGKFHAQKYAALDNVELIGVCDANPETAQKIAEDLGVTAYTDYQNLAQHCDAVSIVTPTRSHYDVCRFFLSAGVHVLVEKPITTTVAQAKELIALAKEHDCVLQVGHIERFNGVLMAARDEIQNPLFIQSQRLAPFNPRGADVNVIYDLMIHDIDIILNLVNAPVTSIEAYGAPVVTDSIDMATARLKFANGCVADLTASRVSHGPERTMQIFQPDSFLNIDFQSKSFSRASRANTEIFPGIPGIDRQEFTFENLDALQMEISAFIEAIRMKHKPVVTGEDGMRALETAVRISNAVTEQWVGRPEFETLRSKTQPQLEVSE